jgi:hypothetical protein
MSKKVSYATRDFLGLRNELLKLVKDYYPDLIKNANDASIFSVFLDLNAGIGDNLHHHIDRVFQETVLQFAQQRASLYAIARTYGLKIPGNRPSMALCDFSINVPVAGDKEDERYLGILKAGAQVNGAGQIFETLIDIDFLSPYNEQGTPNRLKIPNFDSNNNLISYTITKREVVVNGVTKIFKKVITDFDQKAFLKIFLPEKNVLGVISIIDKEGSDFSTLPSDSEFIQSTNKWYEMNSLIEDKVFIEDPTQISDADNFKAGKYIKTDRRFVTEYTPESYLSLTFGSGRSSLQDQLDGFVLNGTKVDLSDFLNNTSLGIIPKAGNTLFVKYRIGGGKISNLGVGVISQIENAEFNIDGPNTTINQTVKSSLRVNNVTAAIGGEDIPTLEEVRNMIAFNFAAQDRCVTLNDYRSKIKTMPGTFGAPAKVGVFEEENKVIIKLLSYTPDGKLTNAISNTLRQNLAEYLAKYRMLNDYVEIESAEVVDLAVDIDVVLDKKENSATTIKDIIQTTTDYFSTDGRDMGDPLFSGELQKEIGNLGGVVQVVDVRIFNKVGGDYSESEVAQPYIDAATRQVQIIDGTVYMKQNQIYQIRFPNKDIRIRTKTLQKINFE